MTASIKNPEDDLNDLKADTQRHVGFLVYVLFCNSVLVLASVF